MKPPRSWTLYRYDLSKDECKVVKHMTFHHERLCQREVDNLNKFATNHHQENMVYFYKVYTPPGIPDELTFPTLQEWWRENAPL